MSPIASVALLVLSLLVAADAGGGQFGPAAANCNCNPVGAGAGIFCLPNGISGEPNTKCLCYPNPSVSSDYYQPCDPGACCKLRRRLMQGADEYHTGLDYEYADRLEECGDYDYATSLYVDTHLYAIASPKKDAVAAGCPFVVTHTSFENLYKEAEKELLLFNDKEDALAEFDGVMLPMGTFKLSALARAYELAKSGKEGSYDVLTNNCAGFMINLATNLGVKIDSKVTSYVARRLLRKAGGALVEEIKNSANYFSFFGNRNLQAESLTTEEIITAVVEEQASDLMA